ncbi:MAG TPA: hypothetical protein VMW12_05030 [Candidatus Dormibacteraeota bacterium]|nr:hypothetical protein [Candidatus Dormibacteraeota bacterium]
MHDLVPLFGIVFLFGAPVAAWVISRVLAHQERMEMIRRGIVPPPGGLGGSRYGRRFDAWAQGMGDVPPPGPGVPPPGMPPPYGGDPSFYAQTQMSKGIRLTLVGLALLIGLSFISHEPGPWILGGLIPMFVGIAQIINALLNGAQVPPMFMRGPRPNDPSMHFGPRAQPGATPPPPPPSPPPAGPAGWRPGPTPEIEKPAQPPDYR